MSLQLVGKRVALGSPITRVLLDEKGNDPILLSDDDPPDHLLDAEHVIPMCSCCVLEEYSEAVGVLEAARRELPRA